MADFPSSSPTNPPIIVQPRDPGWPLRIIWFLLVGWWLSAIFIIVGWALMVTVVLAPLGLWFLHRVPWAQTLRPRSGDYVTEYQNGQMMLVRTSVPQYLWFIRLIYIVFIGWWWGAIWLAVAWALGAAIITLPISVIMIDRSPAMVSLQRN
jgi:hypothetical protein